VIGETVTAGSWMPERERPASPKLTFIGPALESRISSPSENVEYRKSSPTRYSADGQIGCATPPHQMRSPNGNAVTETRSSGRTGILGAQAQDSLRCRTVTNPSHSQMQTHDASSSRNRERRSIQAFALCGDDVSVRQRHSHNWQRSAPNR